MDNLKQGKDMTKCKVFKNCLFIYGCTGSLLLLMGFSLVEASGGYSSLRCAGFRERGFCSCMCGLSCPQGMWDFTELAAQTIKNPPAMQETRVRSLYWEDPLVKGLATHSRNLA